MRKSAAKSSNKSQAAANDNSDADEEEEAEIEETNDEPARPKGHKKDSVVAFTQKLVTGEMTEQLMKYIKLFID